MSRAVVSALAGFVGVPALLAIYIVGIERLLRQVSIRRRRALQPWLWLAPSSDRDVAEQALDAHDVNGQ